MFDEYTAFDYIGEDYTEEQCANDFYAYMSEMYAYEAREEIND